MSRDRDPLHSKQKEDCRPPRPWRHPQDHYLSPVRRVEAQATDPAARLVALTFEDGPTAAPPRPDLSSARWHGNSGPHSHRLGTAPRGAGITEIILEMLAAYGAGATFAVVGTAGEDDGGLVGVAARPDLVRRILEAGHELANHSWRHLPFGPVPGQPRRRWDRDAAGAEVVRLHEEVLERFGYTFRLGRPPHLVDGAGETPPAFAVYEGLGYDYLGLGVEAGGGGPSSGSYDADVEAIVLGLQRRLEKDGRALSGKVVSFHEGYDAGGRSPVVTALPRVLQLLRNYGYRAVTVSALLEASPFADLSPDDPFWAPAHDLLRRGWWVTYRSGEVRPGQPLVRGELAVWASWGGVLAGPRGGRGHASQAAQAPTGPDRPGPDPTAPPLYADVPAAHPYRRHVEEAARRRLWEGLRLPGGRPTAPDARGSRVFGLLDPVGPDEFREVMRRAGLSVGELRGDPGPRHGLGPGVVSHGEAVVAIADALATPAAPTT